MFLISGISSILAIGLLSPVQSIVCLIVLFVSAAISLYSNGFVLMGILYVLIYVGAIAILFLFILSLLNTYGIVENVNIAYPFNSLLDWDLELTTVGSLLYTEYAIPMILIGLILILSVIGAIAITK